MLLPIITPIVFAIPALFIPKKVKLVREWLTILATAFTFLVALRLFFMPEMKLAFSWTAFGWILDFRLYAFSRFVVLAASGFGLLLAFYSMRHMAANPRVNEYYTYILLTLAAVNSALLANNLILFAVAWETLLITLYLLITIGHPNAYHTATKSLVIVGFSDFCMILGIALIWWTTGSLSMDSVHLGMAGYGRYAFILMMIGALAKAGAIPFHTWIPDAALDAPTPVMALLPAAWEKLLGIYLLARICLDFFTLDHTMEIVVMTIGAVTIILAVLGALAQKNYKKLLSFHAVSQVGYMVLGIGTGNPIGIAGGIFHMLNHSMYKCTLFLTGGSVEHRTGTTELGQLGGLGKEMPVTFIACAVAALSISGVPPFNGFISKELVYKGASLHNPIFLIIALLGSTLTLLSFLKLTFSTYLGERSKTVPTVKESPITMQIPMIALAFGCILFGVWSKLPLKAFIQPLVAGKGLEHDLWQGIWKIAPIPGFAMLALLLAVFMFWMGMRHTGRAYTALNYIREAPVVKTIYNWSEKRVFDLYEQGVKAARGFATVVFKYFERIIDKLYEWTVRGGFVAAENFRKTHTGLLAMYLSWLFAGLFILLFIIGGFFK
jgi:NADH-quinone oxidoreductase subunit L